MIDRIETAGFDVLAMKMIHLSRETAGEFYAVHKERPFFPDLIQFMSSGACVPIVLQKDDAVSRFRTLIGATDPAEAGEGTIRRDFAESKQNNIVHGSDSDENAANEIAFFFSEKEIVENMKK